MAMCNLKLCVLVRALYGIVGVSSNLLAIGYIHINVMTSWPVLGLTCSVVRRFDESNDKAVLDGSDHRIL